MLRFRKLLIERAVSIINRTLIFKNNALFPKRFFDDLFIEEVTASPSLEMSHRNLSLVDSSVAIVKNGDSLTINMPFGIGQKEDYNKA